MSKFKTTLVETSCKNLTAKDRIFLKDLRNSTKLEPLVPNSESGKAPLRICVADYAHLHICDNTGKEYDVLILLTPTAEKYYTGSSSFWSAFIDIWNELSEDGEIEPFEIDIYKRPSKNFSGKDFLTCSIV